MSGDHSQQRLGTVPMSSMQELLRRMGSALDVLETSPQSQAGGYDRNRELARLKAENNSLRKQLQESNSRCQRLEQTHQRVSQRLDDSIHRVQQALETVE